MASFLCAFVCDVSVCVWCTRLFNVCVRFVCESLCDVVWCVFVCVCVCVFLLSNAVVCVCD